MAPLFRTFAQPVGIYNELALHMRRTSPNSVPALELSGLYTSSNGKKTPVTLVVEEALQLSTLDLSTLGITDNMIRNAQLSGSTLIISASSNKDLYQVVLQNLSSRAYRAELVHH